EKDVSAQRGLVLALGELGDNSDAWAMEYPGTSPYPFVTKVLELYRVHPDAGVHAAAAWTLRQWGMRNELANIDKEIGRAHRFVADDKPQPQLGDGTWLVNSEGQTFTVIRGPVEFGMGSPPSEPGRSQSEVLHRRRVSRSFAIASTHVTVEQFKRF